MTPADLAARYQAGATLRELADEAGVYPSAVSYHVRRAGVEMRPVGVKKRQGTGDAPRGPRAPHIVRGLELIRERLAAGRQKRGLFAEVASELDMTPQQLHAAWRKYGA